MMILAIDARQPNDKPDIDFAHAWDRWFIEHPRSEIPPALVVLTGVEAPQFGDGWHPPYDWATGLSPREAAVRARIEPLRPHLPPTLGEIVAVGLTEEHPFGIVEQVVPAIAARLHKAERTALIRRLQEMGGRSKVGRLVHQLGSQGKTLLGNLRSRRRGQKAGSTAS